MSKPVHERAEHPMSTAPHFRVAPMRDLKQGANFWLFWFKGGECYASTRVLGHRTKISFHQSGQIHIRLGANKQLMARPIPLDGGSWQHAVELRFLLSDGALFPSPENLKGKQAFMLDNPTGTVLYLNLIATANPEVDPVALPPELLPAAQQIWRAKLRDGRYVVLTSRLFDIADTDKAGIAYVRHELNPKVTIGEPRRNPYVEITQMAWHPERGNVLLIVPMGPEGHAIKEAPSSL